jgi:hypothetical protein
MWKAIAPPSLKFALTVAKASSQSGKGRFQLRITDKSSALNSLPAMKNKIYGF